MKDCIKANECQNIIYTGNCESCGSGLINFRQKPKETISKRYITFAEFVEYGKLNAKTLLNGEPWSFDFYGISVTQENTNLYLLPIKDIILKFTPADMILVEDDTISVCSNIYNALIETRR